MTCHSSTLIIEFPHIAKPGWMLVLLLTATHASVDYFAIVSKNVRFARFALADLRQIAFGHLACRCVVAIRQAIRPPPIDCESARNQCQKQYKENESFDANAREKW